MPQDIRVGADGHTFYVADMMRGGLYVLDGDTMTIEGLHPDRDRDARHHPGA